MNRSQAFKRFIPRPGVKTLAHDYAQALRRREFQAARQLLADSGFHAVSPIAQYHDADAYIQAITCVEAILERLECRDVLTDAESACVVLDFYTRMDRLQITSVAQLLKISDGRISKIESFFDAREYGKMFEVGE